MQLKALGDKNKRQRYDSLLAREVSGFYDPAREAKPLDRPFRTNAKINLEDYLYVPQKNLLIKKTEFEADMLNWEVTHYALVLNGLIMPRADVFMAHFVNLRDASQGEMTLYDGNGNPVKREEIAGIFASLTDPESHIQQTHLDAQFKVVDINNRLKRSYRTNHRVADDYSLDYVRAGSMNMPMREKGYVELEFNEQGLPIRRSAIQKYNRGNNIFFLPLDEEEGDINLAFMVYDESCAGENEAGARLMFLDREDVENVIPCAEIVSEEAK